MSKKLGCPSSARPKILAFGSHCSMNFQPILDLFIPNFKLTYEDSQNIKADSVNRVVFNLLQIKHRAFFEIPGTLFLDYNIQVLIDVKWAIPLFFHTGVWKAIF